MGHAPIGNQPLSSYQMGWGMLHLLICIFANALCQLFNCFMTIRDTFNKILMQTAALAEKLTDLRHWHKR